MKWRSSPTNHAGRSHRPPDWGRTPAAMFAAAVLGFASISGLAWSLNRSIQHNEYQPAPQQANGSIVTAARTPTTSPQSPPARSFDAVKRIDVNTATLAELDLLPGIGPALGQRIIDARDADGPFDSIDDLQRVSGIGPRTVEKLRGLAIVPAEDSRASADLGG
ncbi:MAG: ComEA family DNA-binding protein [Phycisphaerales bacterium]